MTVAQWDPQWVQVHVQAIAMDAYRMVETQHIAATMRLVDTSLEQDVLEMLLEQSKPVLPDRAAGVHYLLAAPFRYIPPTGSRFRAPNRPGLWYGADDPYAACAEIAYWRHRFLLESPILAKGQLATEHSMYAARVEGVAIDTLAAPWDQAAAAWRHPSDYTETHRLGEAVRTAGGVSWIRYASVRAADHVCAAVFDSQCLTMLTAERQWEQWHCLATRDHVAFSNGRGRLDFDF